MPPVTPQTLISDIRQLIETSRSQLASAVNSALTLLYWQIGQRIRSEVLQGQRAEYGEQIILTLASRLEADYGRGFSSKNLRHMLRFAESFPSLEIVSALSRQLAWSHFLEIIYLKDPLKRDFYVQMCGQERWSVRTLRERMGSMLFERTAPGEAPPLGIILCSGKKQEQIELLELGRTGIHVAEYLTVLPPREVLQQKLHEAIARSRQRLDNRGEVA